MELILSYSNYVFHRNKVCVMRTMEIWLRRSCTDWLRHDVVEMVVGRSAAAAAEAGARRWNGWPKPSPDTECDISRLSGPVVSWLQRHVAWRRRPIVDASDADEPSWSTAALPNAADRTQARTAASPRRRRDSSVSRIQSVEQLLSKA